MMNPVLNITPPPSAQQTKPGKAQSTDEFGAALARKMSENSATDKSTAATHKVNKAAESDKSKSVADQPVQTQVPDTATNPLAALMLGNQTIKPAVVADSKTDAKKDPLPADAVAIPLTAAVNPDIKTAVSTASDAHAKKTAAISSAAAESDLARVKSDTAATSVKTDPSVAAATPPKTDTTTFKLADLPAPSAQAMVQSASTLVAASLQPAVSANNSQTTIAAPLGSSAWPTEFTQKVSWISTQQSQVAQLHLNPPDLGPMSVVLSITDNQATALFTSPHSAVREAIENAMPKLRESMAENGIMLGNATVSDQPPPRDGNASNFMSQRNRTESGIAPTAAPPITPLAPVRTHNGMVDTFA